MPSSAKIAGVIGWPVAHSLSPKLHGYWLEKYAIDGEYKAVAVAPEKLAGEIKKLADDGWRGFNLTIPHKESVMLLLDGIDDAAKKIGAVNTVVIDHGKLIGSNTDAYGFMENIRSSITGKNKAVVVGSGGAARAVCHALNVLGFANIVITNRTPSKAEALAAQYPIVSTPWDRRGESLADADLLVNTTSLGMTGKEPLDLDLSVLPKSALVTDIVYTPLMTPLLLNAKVRGNPIVDGLGMLIYQAVPGFAAWFGKRPGITQESLDELKRILLA